MEPGTLEDRILAIDDAEDPRVAAYRAIRERDLVGRQGHFIAEGVVVLRVLLTAARHQALSVLIDRRRVTALAPLLTAVPPDVPIYGASEATMSAIAGFDMHRGVLALGQVAPPQQPAHLLPPPGAPALVLALFGIANHDNMGGLFRNAAAFGVDAVLLDAGCCDPLYRKSIRVSVGAALVVPFARWRTGDDPLLTLEAAGLEVLALSPQGAISLAELGRPARVAVLMGAEGPGLPAALLARSRTVAIPMLGGFDSLNVATASGIVLHHLRYGARPG